VWDWLSGTLTDGTVGFPLMSYIPPFRTGTCTLLAGPGVGL
jgi:hypothetical protein